MSASWELPLFTRNQPSQPPLLTAKMADASIYDEIEIEDMTFDKTLQIYHYPCPCGDRFEIGITDLRDGEEIAVCPSCSLMIRVIYEAKDLLAEEKEEEEEEVKGGMDSVGAGEAVAVAA